MCVIFVAAKKPESVSMHNLTKVGGKSWRYNGVLNPIAIKLKCKRRGETGYSLHILVAAALPEKNWGLNEWHLCGLYLGI